MDANDGAVEGELDFELPLVAVEESGNADQKGEDTNALGKPIRGHEGFPWSGKKKRRFIKKRRFHSIPVIYNVTPLLKIASSRKSFFSLQVDLPPDDAGAARHLSQAH
jgi:hypothetical protein